MTWTGYSPLDERFQSPDEPSVFATCAWCGGEIYVGDPVTTFANGDKTHDGRCEDEYVRAELGLERTIAE
ncbi:hypothetical protein NSS79_10580 [Paenibacillus sp. FSL L8-0436]|uniref:hypothetical protein n=1 Tax=Paenibacillus sp. FSL L8-0436 TaxID=2954686 RepID=UPI003158A7FE